MKTVLRTMIVLGLQLLVVAVLVGQQPQLTRLVTIAGDSTTALVNRGGIEYLPSGVIWVVAGDYPHTGKNIAYLSTDDGTTWVKRPIFTNAAVGSPGAVGGFAAKDANTALVALTTGEILRTTNGGVKWDTVTSYIDGFFDGIRFVSGDTAIAVGDASPTEGVYVGRSFDAGKTWTRVPNVKSSLPGDSLNMGGIYATYASYGNGMDTYGRTVWITLYNTANDPPSILKSTDAGATWSWFRVTLPGGPALNYYIRSISFKDENVGYAVCKRAYVNSSTNDNYLIKTTDGGKTWSDTLSVEPGKAHADAKPMTVKAIRGTNMVIAVGTPSTGSKMWISYNDGTSWTPVTTPSPTATSDLRNFAFGSATQGMAIGYYNMVKISLSFADYVTVTFRANAATWRDTLKGSSGLVQLRGTTMTAAGQSTDDGTTDTLSVGTIIDWNAKTTMYLTNVGGDYWEGKFLVKKGTKMAYKFFANAQNKTVKPNDSFEHTGWEMNVVDIPGFYSTNRGLDLTGVTKDTVLPIQFINGIGHGAMNQYDKPYTTKDSTYALYVRVNMAGWEDFNPANHKLAVRGSNKSDWGQTGELSWGPSYQLNREGTTSFYSNVIHVPNKYAAAGVAFKFVVHYMGNPLSEDWSLMVYNPNTQYDITTRGVDTTIQWKWFDNLSPKPSANKDIVVVTFSANLQQAIAQRGFAIGDTLQVRSGYGSTAAEIRTKAMTRSGITTIFTATDTVVVTVGKLLHYQYYLVKSGTDVREVFFDFDWAGDVGQSERRKVSVTGSTLTVSDQATTSFDMRRMPRFRNTSKLTKAVTVTYTVDVRPAYYTVKAGKKLVSTNITQYAIGNADSVMSWGVWMNGPAVGGWDTRGAWGAARRADTTSKMYDDGTHGDVTKGDSVYTLKYSYTTSDFVGQEFKFGIGGFDNEGGFGNNHIENIDDAASTYTIVSQFGSIDPKFFNAWNYDTKKPQTPTAVEEAPIVPLVYTLNQNYPNPFNPSTVIRFSIANDGLVTLKVFNTLGQEVVTVVNEVMKAGQYNITFDATRLSTGVYFYQLNAGKFVDTKKMVLMK